MATLVEQLAVSVCETRYEHISEEARHRAKQCILDTLGVTLAGTMHPIQRPVLDYLKEVGGREQATVIGFGTKTSAPQAAFANGIFGHVLDYDDWTFSFIGHATVVAVPVILALGEMLKSSGKDLLTAFMVGTEIQWKVGEALVSYGNHYEKGWHSSGTMGTLGAAAAAGKLLGLDREKMANALSVAASEASGMREQFGTMTKSFHVGRAADNGITAALLARGGFTGSRTALEGDVGLFRLMADQYDPEKIKGFGDPWGILDPTSKRGVIFKLYPCCGSGDGATDGIFSLIEEYGLKSEEVESVECFAHEKKHKSLRYHNPWTGLEAKFSLEYWVAAALVYGKLGLEQFTDEQVQRPEVQEFMKKKVSFTGLPEMPGRYPVRVKVNLKNGTSCETTSWPPKASPENPPTDEELIRKYVDCSNAYGLPRDRIDKSIETIMHLEELGDANQLLPMLCK